MLSRIRVIVWAYFFVVGVLLHVLAVGGLLWHYQMSHKSLPHYLVDLSNNLRDVSPRLDPIADGIGKVFFDSGLFVDPSIEFPSHLKLAMPQWRGLGANALRRDTAARYDSSGRPIATTDSDSWSDAPHVELNDINVSSVEQLIGAMALARPGDRIVMAPGSYRLSSMIEAVTSASAQQPIVLSAARVGEVALEFSQGASIEVKGAYWVIANLIVRGDCDDRECPQAVIQHPSADVLTLRNVFASGFDQLLSASRTPAPFALIDGVTVIGGAATNAQQAHRVVAAREIKKTSGHDRIQVLCTRQTTASLCTHYSLAAAFDELPQGGLLLIRAGTYQQAAIHSTPGIHIIAEPGAHLIGASVAGKGALVSDADLTVEGLQCSEVRVASGNGACVRHQRGDMTLIGVHFHHSQMGLLTGRTGGRIRITDSYFHDSGSDGRGNLGHNVYVNSGELEFIRSWSVAARNGGHELKSRASKTVIHQSILASANADDSRLIDIPFGGDLTVTDSVLLEGPNSENWELIGYGLELPAPARQHTKNRVRIEGNTIFFDRPQQAKLLHQRTASSVRIHANTLIGSDRQWPNNRHFSNRSEAGLAPYPFFKKL